MRIQNCQNPIRVYNKYIDEYVWVPCGHCTTCKKRYQNRWTARLENERKSSLFCLFFTLTYDDKHLPRLHRKNIIDDDGKEIEAYEAYDGKFLIPFSEMKFDTQADLDYFNKKMHSGGVPYADFRDVQLFLKRLNKHFHDKYTNKYENFRYWICSELGKDTLRPHYHGILFFKSEISSPNFASDILTCWSVQGQTIGNITLEPVESSAASYVSKYVSKPAYYPSFYSHDKIRNRFICSKRTPIGSLYELQETDAEIFHDTVTDICLPSDSEFGLKLVPLPQYVKNRLFPRCPQFGRISHALRVAVYRSSSCFLAVGFQRDWKSNFSELEPLSFDGFLHEIRFRFIKFAGCGSSFDEYIQKLVSDPYSETGVNCLRRLYYMSKRVLSYCKKFGVTVEYYVHQIEDFYRKLDLKVLGLFYSFQQNLLETMSGTLDEIEQMYSEFAFNNFGDFRDLRFVQSQVDPIPLKECRDYKDMCLEDDVSYSLSIWKHLYNAAMDSIKCTDLKSKNLTLNFYNAKECYEVAKACT